MTGIDPRAGQRAEPSDLIDVPALVRAYYTGRPDPDRVEHRVSFGTSGHRGSSLRSSFNEPHVLAIAEAIARYRARSGAPGPLFLGADSHALSEPARATLLEVFAAHEIDVFVDVAGRFTPTPAVSRAIIEANRGLRSGFADGVVVTPSHNPPEDGGIKYNPPSGGPAPKAVTAWIEREANELLRSGNRTVARMPYERAVRSHNVRGYDFVRRYVDALPQVLDLDAIRGSRVCAAVDPLGGAALAYWEPIAESLGLDLTIVSHDVDPRFAFMTLDWDGRIRMDCSSPFAMARVLELRDDFELVFANDTDGDRFGIVTRGAGLLAPNDYLAIAIGHLFQHRPGWPRESGVGKTVVTSALIDRIAASLGRPLLEVPVGFKWFVDPLLSHSCAFAGEESAGASFLTRTGEPWTTDKDGVLLSLLAIEIMNRSGRDLAELRSDWTKQLGDPNFARIDVPASEATRKRLSGVTVAEVSLTELAGEPVERVLTRAPGNGEAIGGIKVVTRDSWFAARPSGTEPMYKIYAESFLGSDHLERVQAEAKAALGDLLS